MARDLNNDYLEPLTKTFPASRLGPLGDVAKVNCATCHQGAYKPLYGAPMAKNYPGVLTVVSGSTPAEGRRCLPPPMAEAHARCCTSASARPRARRRAGQGPDAADRHDVGPSLRPRPRSRATTRPRASWPPTRSWPSSAPSRCAIRDRRRRHAPTRVQLDKPLQAEANLSGEDPTHAASRSPSSSASGPGVPGPCISQQSLAAAPAVHRAAAIGRPAPRRAPREPGARPARSGRDGPALATRRRGRAAAGRAGPGALLWGWSRIVLRSWPLRGVPGLRFAKALGSGHAAASASSPACRARACSLVFDGEAAADAFLATAPSSQAYRAHARELCVVKLRATSSRGSWGGHHRRQRRGAEAGGPVAALTRASIRPLQARVLAPFPAGRGLAGARRRLPARHGPGRGPAAAPGHLQRVGQPGGDGCLRAQRRAPAGDPRGPCRATGSANRCSCASCRCSSAAAGRASGHG
jgi:hypothetical protein